MANVSMDETAWTRGVSAKPFLGSQVSLSSTANQRLGCAGKITSIGPMYAPRECLPEKDGDGLVSTARSVEMGYMTGLVGYIVCSVV